MSPNRNEIAAARRLLLTAYLLSSSGKARNERELRDNLPPYLNAYEDSLEANDENTELASDALRKVLERDMDALSNVGISISVEGRTDGRRYSLTSEGFSSVEIELDEDERAVLVGALRSLRRDFPYLGPLKMAIANVIGAASEGGSPEGDATFAAIVTRDDERVSSRLDRLDQAIHRKKRVKFDYYAINSGETAPRTMEPYALSRLDGVWYVTGRDVGREAVRQFRISRVRGKVAFATKKDSGDFAVPDDFEPRLTESRAPWQLGESDDSARILVSDDALEAARSRYGFALSTDGADGGGRILSTEYSGERQLAGWVLSLGEGARALQPESLIGRIEDGLGRIVKAHS